MHDRSLTQGFGLERMRDARELVDNELCGDASSSSDEVDREVRGDVPEDVRQPHNNFVQAVAATLTEVQLGLILAGGLRRGGGRMRAGDWSVCDDRQLLAAYWSGLPLKKVVIRARDREFDSCRRMSKIRTAFRDNERLLELLEWPRALTGAEPLRDLLCHMFLAPNEPEAVVKVDAALARLRAASATGIDTGRLAMAREWLFQYIKGTMELAAFARFEILSIPNADQQLVVQRDDESVGCAGGSTSGHASPMHRRNEMDGQGTTSAASGRAVGMMTRRPSRTTPRDEQPTSSWARPRTPRGQCTRRSCEAKLAWWHEPCTCQAEGLGEGRVHVVQRL